ncbi:MAG: MAPEG family protein [Rudaea sp.]|nr:MAPEG family protein [Rudaea sp.]
MAWVNLVTLCALLEYFAFGWLVGRARVKYGVRAPATSGHEIFDRYFRVQQNTLEVLIIFVPSLWIAAQYWNPVWMAAIGAVFLVGRLLYLRGYVSDPSARHIGFLLSAVPMVVLLGAGVIGAVRALFA